MAGKIKDKLSWGGNFCKGVLCCFNFLFLIGGIILLALGIWVLVDKDSVNISGLLTNNVYHAAAYILIVAGVVVAIVSFFGFCGAKTENKCCLGMYVFFLVVIFIIELAAGITALYLYIRTNVESDLMTTLTNNYGGNSTADEAITESWNFIQQTFQCCGVVGNATTNVMLYSTSRWYNQTTTPKDKVPASCCKDQSTQTKIDMCQHASPDKYAEYIYDQGCKDSVRNKVKDYATVLGGIAIAVALTQLMGMVCAICLCKRL